MFSPDGERLGIVVSDGSFRIVTLASGLVTTLGERTDFFGATWTPGDEIVFTRERQLWRMKATGGAATAVPNARDDGQLSFPSALRDADHVLATVSTAAGERVDLVTLSTGERRTLVEDAALPLYADSGHLLFLRSGTLVGARFDAAAHALTGPEVPLMDGLPLAARAATIAISRTGTLLYVSARAVQSHLVWVTREGAERAFTRVPRQYSNPRVSPNGRQVLVQTLAGELWLHDTERETLSPLSTPASNIGFPMWRSDGREILLKTGAGINRLPLTGGAGSHIDGTGPNDYPSGVSPDGGSLAITRLTRGSSADIYIVSFDGAHAPRLWLSTPGYDGGAKWSPNGRWMVYGSSESGQSEIYLQPYPGPGVRRQVSVDGGGHPVWSRDGREIFYRNTSRMYVVAVTPHGDDVVLSQPKQLFDRSYGFGQGISIPNYDVSADGRSFVLVKDSGATRLNVIENWFGELESRTR
jgi:serine/threonine-protein kinase